MQAPPVAPTLFDQVLHHLHGFGNQLPDTPQNKVVKERLAHITSVKVADEPCGVLAIELGTWAPPRFVRLSPQRKAELEAKDQVIQELALKIAQDIVQQIPLRQAILDIGTALVQKFQQPDEATRQFMQASKVSEFYSFNEGKAGTIVFEEASGFNAETLMSLLLSPQQRLARQNSQLLTQFFKGLVSNITIDKEGEYEITINIPDSHKPLLKIVQERFLAPETGMAQQAHEFINAISLIAPESQKELYTDTNGQELQRLFAEAWLDLFKGVLS